MMNLAIAIVAVLGAWLIIASYSRYGALSPISLFTTLNIIMGVGTLLLLDETSASDSLHRTLIVSTAIVYDVVALLLIAANRKVLPCAGLPTWRKSGHVSNSQGGGLAFALFVSLVITSVYYYFVGTSAFLSSLMSVINNEPLGDVATLRLESYAGSRYLFPGYVNQFKNNLAPSLLIVLATVWVSERKYLRVALLTIPVLLGLLGTGQRAPLVMALLLAVTYVYLYQGGRLGKGGRYAIVGGVAVFLGATILTGRTALGGGLAETLGSGFEGVFSRIFVEQQASSLHAFRYIHTLPIANGAEWMRALVGLLPGVDGSSLSSEVFAILYGSTRGTAPPSLWGSVYHNFGMMGSIAVAVLLSFAHVVLSEKGLSKPQGNTLSLVGMAGVFVVTGTWMAGSIDMLLNGGLGMYALIWFVGNHLDSRDRGKLKTVRRVVTK